MAKGPETRIQKKIQDGLKVAYPGSFFFKSHGGVYQSSGLPDLIGTIQGVFIGIEVKTPQKKTNTTKLQEEAIKRINNAGGIAFVAWSLESALEEIKTRLKEYE